MVKSILIFDAPPKPPNPIFSNITLSKSRLAHLISGGSHSNWLNKASGHQCLNIMPRAMILFFGCIISPNARIFSNLSSFKHFSHVSTFNIRAQFSIFLFNLTNSSCSKTNERLMRVPLTSILPAGLYNFTYRQLLVLRWLAASVDLKIN